MLTLEGAPKEVLHIIFDKLSFKDKRVWLLVSKHLHEVCAARLLVDARLIDLDLYGVQRSDLLSLPYLSRYGSSMKNVFIHCGWHSGSRTRKGLNTDVLEDILDIFRKDNPSQFLGFTVPSCLSSELYKSVADHLPGTIVLPPALGWSSQRPEEFKRFDDLMKESGALLVLHQNNRSKADDQSMLYVRQYAPMAAVIAATRNSTRTVRDAIIFGNDAQASLARQGIKKPLIDRIDLTALPSITSIGFFDICGNVAEGRDVSVVDDQHQTNILDRLREVQNTDSNSKGLHEFLHVQKKRIRHRDDHVLEPRHLNKFLRTQRSLTVLCIHQNRTGVPLVEYALPTLKIVLIRDSNEDVDNDELGRFASIASGVTAWGDNWSPITLVNTRAIPDFNQRAQSFARSFIPMKKQLRTIALFTPDMESEYNQQESQIEMQIVGRLVKIFAEVGITLHWVLIVHSNIRVTGIPVPSYVRDPRGMVISEDLPRSNMSHCFRVVARYGNRFQIQRVAHADLPRRARFEHLKLGCGLTSRYEHYEQFQLRDNYFTDDDVKKHITVRQSRSRKEKKAKEKRELPEQAMKGRKRKAEEEVGLGSPDAREEVKRSARYESQRKNGGGEDEKKGSVN